MAVKKMAVAGDVVPWRHKKIVCVDFDGVIHACASKWQGVDVIVDGPVPGAFAWLLSLLNHGEYKPVIYSARSVSDEGRDAMRRWFEDHGFPRVDDLEFPAQKPPAYVTIDDRALCFRGQFPTTVQLDGFRAWNRGGARARAFAHFKHGDVYELVADDVIDADTGHASKIVYRSRANGQVYVRDRAEFMGRVNDNAGNFVRRFREVGS